MKWLIWILVAIPLCGQTIRPSKVATPNINGVLFLDGSKYACTLAGLQSALADSLTAGGGIVNTQPCPTIALTGPSVIGDGTHSVTLILPNNGVWTLTGITNGTDCFLKVMGGSSIFGFGAANDGNKLTLQNGSTLVNADSMICTNPTPAGGGSYVRVEGGVILYNPNGTAGTYVNGLLHAQKVFDASSFRNISIANTNGIGLYVKGVNSGATFEKIVSDGQGGAGAIPVLVDGASGFVTTAVSFLNLSADHAGVGQHEIEVKGGGFTGAVNFYNTYVETNPANTGATSHIQLTSSQGGVNFYGGQVAVENASDTGYCFDVTSNTGNELGVYGFSCEFGGAAHSAINDHVSGYTVASDATGSMDDYSTDAFLAPTIASGFGTSPSIVNSRGTKSFEVNVGTGGTATSGVLTMPTLPAAKVGWSCSVWDMNTNIVTRETAFTATSITLTAASAWTASDKLLLNCGAF